MDLNDLNFLPEWDESRYKLGPDDAAEEWRKGPARAIAKAMYKQWREVFGLVIAFAENLADDGEESHPASTKALIYENVMIVAPKIIGAISMDLYVLKMENAAHIRANCKQMMEQIGFAVLMGWADEDHKNVIEEGLQKFRELFRQWVSTFQKDGYEDDWGLFL
ncbi:MAG: hypothetical protein EAZ62_00640 [Sphingobacteriia bacterium]|nr:MAG: hypothetical protein EAZ62_00640 [Sphingobacteriia bacterium]